MIGDTCQLRSSGNTAYVPFLDIDECGSRTDDCDANAVCNNTIGSYTCTCVPPYSGNGQVCGSELFFKVKRLFPTNIFYAVVNFH